MIDPAIVLVFCRGVIFGAILLLWGAALFRRRLLPGTPRKTYEILLLVALVLAVIALLPVQVARLTGNWASVLDPNMVWRVIERTTPGQSFAMQAIASVALVLAFWRKSDTFIVLAGLGLMIGFSLTGHAAASDGFLGLLRQANNVLHLMASAAWLGALPYVAGLLRRLHEPGMREVLIRYSSEGHVWVALVLLTGLVATIWIFAGIPTQFSARYQLLWLLKVLVTLTMVGLAIFNRYVLVPRLRGEQTALATLRRNALVQIATGLAAVSLVAWFGTLDPHA